MILFLLICIAAPFLVVQCARGWPSWIMMLVATLAGIFYAYLEAIRPYDPGSLDFGRAFIVVAAYSAGAGVIIRAGTLVMATKGVSKIYRAVASIAGVLAILTISLIIIAMPISHLFPK